MAMTMMMVTDDESRIAQATKPVPTPGERVGGEAGDELL